jgi:catechol 2,3-dioxygenase-like lactoylglutathione lyase family enzyme
VTERPIASALHHTSLTVSDLERSLAFYRDVLGLEVAMQQEKEGGYLAKISGYPDAHVRMAQLELPGGSHRIELFQYLAPPGERPPLEPRNVGITHVCLVVDDIHEAYERIRRAPGVEPYSEPVELDSGANKGGFGLYVRDPDGITLELFQPPRR